ncbi:hypothetical protein N2152v2_009149 [Parachlorella kessleri]
MACLLARQPAVPPNEATPALTDCQIASSSCFDHIAKALQLLCNLCDSAAQNRTLRTEILLSQEFVLEVVDAVNLLLLAMAGPEAQRCLDAAQAQGTLQEALDRASLVPGALRALAYAFTAVAAEPVQGDAQLNWDSIADTLLQHPRGSVLLEVVFDAVRTLVLAVRAALTASEASSDDVYKLAFHAGAALELLSYLCTTPLFYYRLMLHDPSGAAPLRLVLACLTLHDAPLAAPPFVRLPSPPKPATLASAAEQQQQQGPPPQQQPAAPSGPLASFALGQPPYTTAKGQGAAELLVARGCALLVMLADFEEPSYMDQLFGHTEVTQVAHEVLRRAATYVSQVLLRPSTSQHPPAPGEPQMAVNVLRAAELLSDDSNFKPGLIQLLAREVAQLLCMDPATFKSRWCAGEEAVAYHCKDEILVNSVSNHALEGVERMERASKKVFPGGKQARAVRMGQQMALERGVLLFKVIGNLHCTARDGIEDAFVSRVLALLRPNQAALIVALHNLRQLQQMVVPWGPPHASEDAELVTEVDLSLFADFLNKLEKGRVPPQLLQVPPQLLAMRPPPQQQQQPQQQLKQQQGPRPPLVPTVGPHPMPPMATAAAAAAARGTPGAAQAMSAPAPAVLQVPMPGAVPARGTSIAAQAMSAPAVPQVAMPDAAPARGTSGAAQAASAPAPAVLQVAMPAAAPLPVPLAPLPVPVGMPPIPPPAATALPLYMAAALRPGFLGLPPGMQPPGQQGEQTTGLPPLQQPAPYTNESL